MFERGFKSWCENVAIQQRKELHLQPADALDPQTLARHLGIIVWKAERVPGLDPRHLRTLLQEDPDSWSAVTICVGSKNLIILNSAHSGARPASDLMHEISHLMIDHRPSRVDITEDGLLMLNSYDKKQEEEATWLAGCLLLPRSALLLIRRNRMKANIAAQAYGVSEQMLRFRMNMSGVENQFSRARRIKIQKSAS